MCALRVSASFTVIIQQIHSLRAKGVKLSHFSKAVGFGISAFRKSSGRSCTTPPVIFFVVIGLYYRGLLYFSYDF